MNGLFVVGTDTDVGKTVVSSILMAAAPQHTRYWKPFQTGYPADCDTRTVQNLANLNEHRVLNEGLRLQLPASPHHAAYVENSSVSLTPLFELIEREKSPKTTWIVEGVGGLMVPLNDQTCLPTFIHALELPCVVVASTKLGTINHTLLTVAQLETLKIPTLGILMVGEEDPSATSGIQQHSPIPILGHLPHLATLSPKSIATCVPLIHEINPIMKNLNGDMR